MTTKEVAVKQNNALTTEMADMMAEFDYSAVESKDLKIPKLLLMQASSKFVKDEDICKTGDLVNSVDGTIYGAVREKDYRPVRVIPIHMFKTWVISEILPGTGGQNKLEYVQTIPVTPENTDMDWEVESEGRRYKNTKCVNFFVLLESDIGNPMALPHVLTFRSTSIKEAGIIANHFALCAAAKAAKQFRVPMDRFFEIGGKKKEKDDQSWYVLTAKESGPTSKEAMEQAFGWYKQVKALDLNKVDNSDLEGTSETTVSETPETEF